MTPMLLNATDARYPARLRERLGKDAPPQLTALGNLDLLTLPKTALFCSTRCPGDAILRACDTARQWRDENRCIISGFHSVVEKECLRILLRGSQPVIICPSRSLKKMRLAADWKKPLADGRLLVLSCFSGNEHRMTSALAIRRNEFVAALADEVWFAHVAPGGQMQRLANIIANRKAVGVAGRSSRGASATDGNTDRR
jgi:predicted Rossmann fold nucleotide-binding protein DprA/Smf involved in DNA uptake